MMHKLLFILLFAATAAAASKPAKIAQSPDGNLEILQKQSDGSYVLYTRYRAGRLKEWTDTPREPEIEWHGNTASVRISGGSYSSIDEFTDGRRRYTASNLVALNEADGCYLGTDDKGRLAFAKFFDPENTVRLSVRPKDMMRTATPLSTLDYQESRFLANGDFRLVYTNRAEGTSTQIFRRPCQTAGR